MNRLKRKRRNKKIKILLLSVFVIGLMLVVPAYAYMRQKLNLNGNAQIFSSDYTGGNSCMGGVIYEITKWSNNDTYTYKIALKLTNNSDQDFNFWDVYFDVPSDVELLNYSGTEAEVIGTKIKTSNVSYNGVISPGNSVFFEVQISTLDSSYEPTNFVINNCHAGNNDGPGNSEEPDDPNNPDNPGNIGNVTNNLEINYVVVGSYGDCYQYDVVVKNIGNEKISGWSFSIIKPKNTSLSNSWNVNYIIKDDIIEFSNVAYNGSLDVGESISFGLVMATDIVDYIPSLAE